MFDLFAWTSHVYSAAQNGGTIYRIARNTDPDDLAQEVVEWLFKSQDTLAIKASQAEDANAYIRTAINNKARDIVNARVTAERNEYHAWLVAEYDVDRVHYPKEFIKENKQMLFGVYEPDSYSQAIQCDMQLAFESLTAKEQEAFLSTRHDDSLDPVQRKRDSAARSKAETKVWQHMNNYAEARSFSLAA